MAEEPEKSSEPNLELPSLLGFRRKKKGRAEPPVQDDTDPLAADPVEPPRSGLAPAVDAPKRRPPVPPPTAPTEPEPVTQVPPPPPAPEPEPIAEPEPEPVMEPEPEPQPEPQPEPVMEPEPVATPEPVTEPAPAPAKPAGRRAARERRPRAQREPVALPVIAPRIAAALTGAVVGLVGVLLARLSASGCEVIRGVGSCGGVGLFALLAILAIEVALGAALLKAWRLSDPVSTSFLGVGLAAMLVLLFLLGSLESVWMILVLPVLTTVTFLVSWWVTVSFAEDTHDTLLR